MPKQLQTNFENVQNTSFLTYKYKYPNWPLKRSTWAKCSTKISQSEVIYQPLELKLKRKLCFLKRKALIKLHKQLWKSLEIDFLYHQKEVAWQKYLFFVTTVLVNFWLQKWLFFWALTELSFFGIFGDRSVFFPKKYAHALAHVRTLSTHSTHTLRTHPVLSCWAEISPFRLVS